MCVTELEERGEQWWCVYEYDCASFPLKDCLQVSLSAFTCICMCMFCLHLFLIFLAVCVLTWLRVLIIYHQLQLVGSSSHSSWCMLIGQPEAETADLIYKPIQLVLWGIDLPVSPSVKHSPCLYSEWQQVIKVCRWKRTMKVFTITLLSAITFSDIHILRCIPDMPKSWKLFFVKQGTQWRDTQIHCTLISFFVLF